MIILNQQERCGLKEFPDSRQRDFVSGGTFSFREKAQRTLGSKGPRQVPAFFKDLQTQELFVGCSEATLDHTAAK